MAGLSVFGTAFLVSLSLIMAIGAQNAYVLRQGIRGQFIWPVVFACALSDTLLICFGVFGGAALERWLPGFANVVVWCGAAFLVAYGAMSLRSAWRGGQTLEATEQSSQGLGKVVATILALTWLNPHVYLDTVLLIGAISRKYPDHVWEFAAGACMASFVFFIVLANGARRLRPLFARAVAWQVLDAATGLLMWFIALKLLID